MNDQERRQLREALAKALDWITLIAEDTTDETANEADVWAATARELFGLGKPHMNDRAPSRFR